MTYLLSKLVKLFKGVRKGVRKGYVRNKNWNDVVWKNRKHHGINAAGKRY